ncbi:MAG TPA: spirocyclase AveC family protein, partial [Acidimicrobiia bacterium]|nr:spirocyclase AveC family protein [Acidimicrobiia bacterium]
LRWFRDDRGLSVAERGAERLRLSGPPRTALRFLAVTGFIHVWFIVGYFVPYNFFALKADTFPPMPSFLRAGICGQGTDYACPSGAVPIPHGRSLHVAPDDPRLPADVRAHQGLPGR